MLGELDRAGEDSVSFLVCAHAVAAARAGAFTDARRLFALRFDEALRRRVADLLSSAPAATDQQPQQPQQPEQHGNLLSSAPAAPAQQPQQLQQPEQQPQPQQKQQHPAQHAHRWGESHCGGDLFGSNAAAVAGGWAEHQFVHQVQQLKPLLAATPGAGAQQTAPTHSQPSASPPTVYARNGRLLQCHYCRGNHKRHVCPVLQREGAHVPASRPTSSVGRHNRSTGGGPGLLPTPLICVVADGGRAKPGAGRMGPCLLHAARRLCPGQPWWRAASHRDRRRKSAVSRPSVARPAAEAVCTPPGPAVVAQPLVQEGMIDTSCLLSIFEASTGDDHAPSPITSPAASESSAQSQADARPPVSPFAGVQVGSGLRSLRDMSWLQEEPRGYRFATPKQVSWEVERQRRKMWATLSFDAPTAEELELQRQGTPMRLAAALPP